MTSFGKIIQVADISEILTKQHPQPLLAFGSSLQQMLTVIKFAATSCTTYVAVVFLYKSLKKKKVNITDVRIKSSTKRNNAWNYFGLYMFCCRFNYILNCRGFTSIFAQSVMNPFMVLALIKAFIICHDFCTQCVSELVLDAIITSLTTDHIMFVFFAELN